MKSPVLIIILCSVKYIQHNSYAELRVCIYWEHAIGYHTSRWIKEYLCYINTCLTGKKSQEDRAFLTGYYSLKMSFTCL